MLRLRGDWSFGHVGCGQAVLLHLLSVFLLLGLSIGSLLTPDWMRGAIVIAAVVGVLILSTSVEYFRRHGPMVRSVELALDDGGLRLWIKGAPHYVQFRDLELEPVPPDTPRSFVVPGPHRRMKVDLATDDCERAAAFLEEIAGRRKRASTTPDELAPLLRRGESLQAWSARVLALVEDARRATGYRTSTDLDDDTLRSIMLDPSRDPDLRAAAGYALMRVAPGHAVDVRRACEEGAPPIVVALCYAGAGEGLRAAFAVVAEFLPRGDRRAAERLAAAITPS